MFNQYNIHSLDIDDNDTVLVLQYVPSLKEYNADTYSQLGVDLRIFCSTICCYFGLHHPRFFKMDEEKKKHRFSSRSYCNILHDFISTSFKHNHSYPTFGTYIRVYI